MPDGTIFVASGSLNGLDPTVPANNNPTYEILSPKGISSGNSITLDILQKNQPYYMYPFIHLLNDGTLFIFVSKSAQIFSVGDNEVVQELPDLPGDFRTYPNTGGSVLLPLSSSNGWAADILICGGGAYQDITSPTDSSCGRVQPQSANPTWSMESMPEGRGMVEGTLLPDGTVIWLNGCNQGAQGFGLATAPTLEALIYNVNTSPPLSPPSCPTPSPQPQFPQTNTTNPPPLSQPSPRASASPAAPPPQSPASTIPSPSSSSTAPS